MPPFVGRTIQVIWDTVNLCFYDPVSGQLLSTPPYLSQGEQVLAQIQYINGVDSNDNYVLTPIMGISEFSANIDNIPDEQVTFAVAAEQSAINVPGDWIDGGTADPTQGQVSVRLDGSQSGVSLKMPTNINTLNCKLEVQGLTLSGTLAFVQRLPFFLYNNQNDY